MSRKHSKVLTLHQILGLLTKSFDKGDETEFAYIIIVPLELHYFQYETENNDDEILEQEVNDIPGFPELHSPHGLKKSRNELWAKSCQKKTKKQKIMLRQANIEDEVTWLYQSSPSNVDHPCSL